MTENKTRCAWCEKDDLYRDYHDNEWGKPVYDDQLLFEFFDSRNLSSGLELVYYFEEKRKLPKSISSF